MESGGRVSSGVKVEKGGNISKYNNEVRKRLSARERKEKLN